MPVAELPISGLLWSLKSVILMKVTATSPQEKLAVQFAFRQSENMVRFAHCQHTVFHRFGVQGLQVRESLNSLTHAIRDIWGDRVRTERIGYPCSAEHRDKGD